MITLRYGLTIGQDAPVRVNCNIGCNSRVEYDSERQKIDSIKRSKDQPDMVMDLSLVQMPEPLYKIVRKELNVEVGTVLSYLPFSKEFGLQWNLCRDYLVELCKGGISFVTIHFTASFELYELAKSIRKIPVTSRGGAMCIYDCMKNNRENVYMQHIDEIIAIVNQYDVAISLGATFRSANIFDACDIVHLKETRLQLQLCKYLHSKGVKAIVENIGHISLDKLKDHAKLLQAFNAPIMPLGPLPTDAAIGFDHVNNAIGAAFAAHWNCAHVINAVTRQEHTGEAITIDNTLEAIHAARLSAHIVNIEKGFELYQENNVDDKRMHAQSCLISGGLCARCSAYCPLKFLKNA